jgi:hypothetical protein|tara:strand:- start:1197 stop:2429 length:1233 start_codon:yes stop_codon:yes gene_type:complete
MNRSYILILSLLFTSLLIGQEKTYTIKGEASFVNGLLVGDAEVILMDTTEKVIQKIRTSKKLFKKYGGGKFTLLNVPSGDYIINVDFGTRIGITTKVTIKDKNLNLGTIYNVVEFPEYKINEYLDTTTVLMKRISTIPVREDSINIRFIMVDLDGNAKTVIVDSMVVDSIYFTDANSLQSSMIQKDKIYFIYNDYGVFIYQSRSFKDRINELQKRDGFLIFQNNDTLQFDNIFFENEMDNPQVATFHIVDSTINTNYHSIFDIYKVKTGPSYVGTSVQKGFWTGVYTIGSIITFQMLTTISFKPILKLVPDFTPPIEGSYGTVVTIIPLFTLGIITYDWYTDKRSNYFIRTHEETPYPNNMFVFSFSEWAWKKSQPVMKPIMDSRPVKWWKNRKLRRIQKDAAKRKSASG